MSDWLDAARGRFEFLRRVAELHGGADLAQCDTDSRYEERLEIEADMFARRFLRETVGLPASEAAERCGLIANQIRDKNPGKRAL